MILNTCINADSLAWMTAYDGPQFADLVFADPPFNIKWKYDVYIDEMPYHEFIDWNKRWISTAIAKIMKPNAQIFICMGDEYVSEIDMMCRHEFGLHKQNWLIWNYSFGQSGKLHERKRFTRSKTHILRFSKHKKVYTFNGVDIAVPSDRQLAYADKRADPRGKCPDDVLCFKRICGTHKDRVPGVSTQMGADLVSTLIKATTNPGDMIYDPFPGSGISCRVARSLNRNFFATELSPNYTLRIQQMLGISDQPHNNS